MRGPITLLIPNMDGGGTERAILMLGSHWAQAGVEVHLILFRREGPLLDLLHSDIRIHSLESDLPVVQIFRLIRFLREHSTKTLLCALNPANAVAVAARVIGRLDTKVIASVQNHFGAKYTYAPSIWNPFRKQVLRWVFAHADVVVPVSQSIRDYLIESIGVHPDKIRVIYNPVEILPIEAIEGFAKPMHAFFDSSEPVLIAAGRLTRQKNFQLLVRAMTHLPENIRLILLGEGEDRDDLEQLVKDLGLSERVSMVGFQSNPLAWFAQADCYVMSSDWEGFPFVLLEAMSVGLQVVSTDCLSGPEEILSRGEHGILVDQENLDSLSVGILMALESPFPKGKLISRASDFSIDTTAVQYVELMQVGYKTV